MEKQTKSSSKAPARSSYKAVPPSRLLITARKRPLVKSPSESLGGACLKVHTGGADRNRKQWPRIFEEEEEEEESGCR